MKSQTLSPLTLRSRTQLPDIRRPLFWPKLPAPVGRLGAGLAGISTLAAAVAMALTPSIACAAPEVYMGSLTGAAEAPPNASAGLGAASRWA